MRQPVLLVFAKAPVPGQVKSRLCPPYTPQQAAAIHAHLVRRTLRMAADLPMVDRQLWCSPHCEHAFLRRMADQFALTRHQQVGDDLGMRMHNALTQALSVHPAAVLIGSDCITLSTLLLESAFRHLNGDGHQAVIAPATDGGYVLVGLRRPARELFSDMPWGSDQVMAVTRARLRQLALPWAELPAQRDVDRPQDVRDYELDSPAILGGCAFDQSGP